MELNLHGLVKFQSIAVVKLDVEIYLLTNQDSPMELLGTVKTNLQGQFNFILKPGFYRLKICPKFETRLIPMLSEVFELDNDSYFEFSLSSGFYITGKICEGNNQQQLLIYSENSKLLTQEIRLQENGDFKTVLGPGNYHLVLRQGSYTGYLKPMLTVQEDTQYINNAFNILKYNFKIVNLTNQNKFSSFRVFIIPQNMVEYLTNEILNINQEYIVNSPFSLFLEPQKNYFLKLIYPDFYYIYHLKLNEVKPHLEHEIDIAKLIAIKSDNLKPDATLKIRLMNASNELIKNVAVFYFLYNKENKNQLEELISEALISNHYGLTNSDGELALNLEAQIYGFYIYPFLEENLRPKFIQQLSVNGSMTKTLRLEIKA